MNIRSLTTLLLLLAFVSPSTAQTSNKVSKIANLQQAISKILQEKFKTAPVTFEEVTIHEPYAKYYVQSLENLLEALNATKNPKTDLETSEIRFYHFMNHQEGKSFYLSADTDSGQLLKFFSKDYKNEPFYNSSQATAQKNLDSSILKLAGTEVSNFIIALRKLVCSDPNKVMVMSKQELNAALIPNTPNSIDYFNVTRIDKDQMLEAKLLGKGAFSIRNQPKYTVTLKVSIGSKVELRLDPDCNIQNADVYVSNSQSNEWEKKVYLGGDGTIRDSVFVDREVLPLKDVYKEDQTVHLTRNVEDLYKTARRTDRVLVTILDIGVDYNHPELAFKIPRKMPELNPDLMKFVDAYIASSKNQKNSGHIQETADDEFRRTLTICAEISTSRCHSSRTSSEISFSPLHDLAKECIPVKKELEQLRKMVQEREEINRETSRYAHSKCTPEDLEKLRQRIIELRSILAKDSLGWNFELENSRPYDSNDTEVGQTHGTHVAAIAGRGSDSIAILPLKKGLYGDSFYDAIAFAHERKSRIVNLSFGGYLDKKHYESWERAIKKFPDMLFVCAAGNEGTNNDLKPHFPASFNYPNVLAVAAVDREGALHFNYGPRSVHIAALGVDVNSATPEKTYRSASGTSMAAPRVTNVAAKILAINPKLSPKEIIAILEQSVDKTSELKEKIKFGGILNERRALELAVRSIKGLENCSSEVINKKIKAVTTSEEPILKEEVENLGTH